MQEPADNMVDGLRLRERLMPALVGDDPKACAYKARGYGVGAPESKRCSRVKGWARQRQVLGSDQRVQELGALVEASKEQEVPSAANTMSRRTL